MNRQDRKTSPLIASLSEFLKLESAGGIVLMIAAALAIIIANTPLNGLYEYVLEQIYLTIGFSSTRGFAGLEVSKPLLLWINDGLMAIFFFLVGLEIKREFLEGELSSRDRALLPALAAVGGMVVPALFYFWQNYDNPELLSGWAIPAATDIAFALGILALVGSRAPLALKVLLTAIAIIDDLGAILIIAIFYTSEIYYMPLAFGLAAFIALAAINRANVVSIAPYVLLGFVLWFAVLKSGVHATLAGVVTALFVPLRDKSNPQYSPVKELEHGLHPWVAFMVLPIFAFANAGVSFAGMTWADIFNPVTMGIFKGLFFGKQIGIFLLVVLVIKLKLSPMPKDTNWWQLYAVSLLCGVGFTMSLFIGELAFEGREQEAAVRMGVILGSIASAVLGYLILRFAPVKTEK
jgi:NhaA family Na+:H+ antiporter